ncbi:MAG: hypothetical protein ACRCYQ_15500 [Nocardioides sp.]
MKTHDDTIMQALQSLDPADRTLTERQRTRSATTLAGILATDPERLVGDPRPARPARAGRRRLWIALPVAAASVLAALAAPSVISSESAFAGWSEIPQPLARAEAQKAAEICLKDRWDAFAGAGPAPATSRVLLSERRGGHIYVSMLTDDARELSCLLPAALEVDDSDFAESSYGTAKSVDDTPEPGARQIREETYAGVPLQGDNWFEWTEGKVGSEITRVWIELVGKDLRIEASVGNGRYAAWWPRRITVTDGVLRAGEYRTFAKLRDGTVIEVPSAFSE